MLLVEQYQEQKNVLSQKLEGSSTPQEAVQVVYDFVSQLSDSNSEYVYGLSRTQGRVALAVLGVYREQLANLLKAFNEVSKFITSYEPESSYQEKSQDSSFLSSETIPEVLTTALVAGLLPVPGLSILVAIASGLTVSKVLKQEPESSRRRGYHPSENQRQVLPRPDYRALLSELEFTLQNTDNVVRECASLEEAAHPRPVEPKLEDHRRFLEFLQDLVGWYQRNKEEIPEPILKTLQVRLEEHLPDLLSEYNIQINYYDPNESEHNLALFNYEDEVGESKLTAPLMIRPALSKQDAVILRGRVVEPRQVN